uniref:Pentatricopeptide repeat-containing protein n=1 Tax=Oryza meridionalis TaxID=40149 RepID=A0A0E0DBZ9_9ORYZ
MTWSGVVVDVLGRSGNLDDALQVISDMNVKPDGRIWAQKLMELEPGNVSYHVVFSNAQAGTDLQKLPAWTCVSKTMQQLGCFTFARRRSKMKSCCEVAGVWSWCHSHKSQVKVEAAITGRRRPSPPGWHDSRVEQDLYDNGQRKNHSKFYRFYPNGRPGIKGSDDDTVV